MALRTTPYWWESSKTLAPGIAPSAPVTDFPDRFDAVVVGAGLTGVSAAHELASAGRSVLVLDAGAPGWGASSRNAGMVGRYFKHSFGELITTHGLAVARDYFTELRKVYDSCVSLIKNEGLDCDFRPCGRFVGAVSENQRAALFREWELRAQHLGEEVEFVSRSDDEIGQGVYHGGVRILENASLHPARYYEALKERAVRAGAIIVGNTPVLAIEGDASVGFEVLTARSKVRTRDIIVATNGYSDLTGAVRDVSVRVAPINASMIATEQLPADLLASLWPFNRTYHDSRRDSSYMQLSPDGTRLLFGGRTGLHRHPDAAAAEAHRRDMVALFPQLGGAKVEFVWTGKCAATRDLFPHVGMHKGMHYALGYCFSGNAMAPYLGRKAALRVLNDAEADTVFQEDRLLRMPWPARQEWLMPAVIHYYRWADRPTPVPQHLHQPDGPAKAGT